MEEIKIDEIKTDTVAQIDLGKLCRTCLGENGEMRSVFMMEEATGQTMSMADMLMRFANVEVDKEDGLPQLICLQCILQLSRGFSFKQLCEQSDCNLRQYLGKPPIKLTEKKEDPEQSNFNNSFLIDSFNDSRDSYNDSSTSSDSEDFKEEITIVSHPVIENETEEKVIAHKQLLQISRTQNGNDKKKKCTTELKGSKKPHVCNVCKKTHLSLKAFRKHLRTHVEDRPYKCKQCSKSFTEENYLNNHMRSHIPDSEKPHECEYCKKRYTHPTLLNNHMLRHTGERPYVCEICNKGCYAENSLLKHMKIHMKKKGDPGLLKHICDYCRTEYPSAEALSVHIKQHSGDRPYLCNICGKTFPQRFNLELHSRTHTGERPFECEICKNGYVSKASLKIHMRTHTNERPFVCDFCGKAFRQSGDLTSHKRLHGTDKPIECNVCLKRFTTVMKLKYHMRNHTGERPYVCTVCNRGFTVNTILLRHMRVHSGERPYVCVTCGKAFSQSSTLHTHMKVHQNADKFDQEKETKYDNEIKYNSNQQQTQQHIVIDNANRLIQPIPDSRMLQQAQPMRTLQSDNVHDSSRLLTEATHFLTDNRTILNDNSRILVNDPRLVVNVVEPNRLLVQDNTGRPLINDNRLVTIDNRLLNNVNDNRQIHVAEGTRILTDKYITYDSYHRGHM
ncbi:zinc finger protein 2 homolog [Sitophilus oryzae]|uniref:Zinc finger protein 2 homolog n=1 Tax=Sitophilus oryzae TaxID=7048 RepID=A0A6J2YQ28_SITOR|nr:zinc finger protein 2 homolog [Sitophilus oryzae]